MLIALVIPLSRKSSTNTVTQVPAPLTTTVARPPIETHSAFRQRKQSREASRRSLEASPKLAKPSMERLSSPSAIASSSSSSESEDTQPMSRSRGFARWPRYSSARSRLNPLSDADEEDDDSPPFLPFSTASASIPPSEPHSHQDPGATVRIFPKQPRKALGLSNKARTVSSKPTRTANSSSSSAQSQPRNQNKTTQVPLSTLSPRQRRLAKEGSDGTPSMGSSFSDLDNDSVTQSALEEALAEGMQQGGVASRMSTISQALRSRYL